MNVSSSHTESVKGLHVSRVGLIVISEHDLEILRNVIRRSGAMRRWKLSRRFKSEAAAIQHANSCAFRAKAIYESALLNAAAGPLADDVKRKVARAAIAEALPSKLGTGRKKGKLQPLRRKARAASPRGLQDSSAKVDSRVAQPTRSRYDPSRAVVAARVETPSYARKIDEGFGGTREQALKERQKLSAEMRRRARDFDD